MDLETGTRIGPYQITGVVGAGGMGHVYRARDPRIGRDVAIKILPAAFASDPDRVRRFEQETRATGLLNHPNVLTIYDTGVLSSDDAAGRSPYIVAELLEGATLRAELDKGPLAVRKTLDYAIQIARGLSAAHAKGIVHRDLKPENVFITTDGRAKILDFGVSKLVAPSLTSDTTQTEAGLVIGTVGYMSPEQARGQVVDPRSDLFSFGAILYEMLTGRRAFQGATAADTLSAILREDPAPFPDNDVGVPTGLHRLVLHCLDKVPEHRFQSATDLLFELENLSPIDPATARAAVSVPGSRLSGRLMAVTALLVVVTGAAAFWYWRGRHVEPARQVLGSPRVTPFLTGDDVEKDPAWSPGGNLIAYVSDAAGNDDIWISDSSGAHPINLTAGFTGIDGFPAWSPDSQHIAFFSERDGGGVFTMTALGGDVRKAAAVKSGVEYTFSLTWARDDSLVYTNFDDAGVKQVYRISLPASAPACLTCGAVSKEGARAGDLSPSGRLLAFKTSEIGARGTLHVLDLASGRVRRIADQVDLPRWSPDGRSIIYISGRDGLPDLWQIAIDPVSGEPLGEPERLTSGLGATAFTLAPDGRQILAVRQKSTSSLWTFPATAAHISDLATGQRLTTGEFLDARGRWMPDGRGVVFQSNRRGSFDVWSLASPGAPLVRITSNPAHERRPRVSPDGRWIAVDVSDGTGEHLQLMRPDGSGLHMPDESWRTRFSINCCADWSPDGTRLAMHVDGTATALVRLDPATGMALETKVVDLPGADDEYHRWSPDGRLLAYEAVTDGSWDLWLVDSDGTHPRRLTNLPGNERQAAWRPGSEFLYFEMDRGAIWRVPLDASGRPTAPPGPWLEPPRRFEVDADSIDFTRAGDRVLVTLLERASDIWLVEFGVR